jgi:hypothetical protein
VRNSYEQRAYFAQTSNGRSFILPEGEATWTELTPIDGTAGVTVTFAHVSGETYIYFSGIGCYKYNFATVSLDPVTLTGLEPTSINGICGAVGYLIAWSTTEIAWSSTIDPTDFVPSLATGAGGGAVEGARGQILLCAPITSGLVVYTIENAVAAVYSGNSRYPFNFKELTGSGGLTNVDNVALEANASTQYAYTTSGLQSVSLLGASTVFPEVTDFISGQVFEDFNETTRQFEVSNYAGTSTIFKRHITVVSDRYLVISYGVTSLTHALVYDLIQKRWGKLKIPHVQCFEHSIDDPLATEPARNSIAFLQADGTIITLQNNHRYSNANGVIILGKYQFIRQRTTQLELVDIENVEEGDTFEFYDLFTLDGKNLLESVPTLITEEGQLRIYSVHKVGKNHSLLFKGAFNLSSLMLTFVLHGRR